MRENETRRMAGEVDVQSQLKEKSGLQEVEASSISGQSAYEGGKAVSPTLRSSLSPPQEISLVPISFKRLCRSQDHSAAGRIKSMKNAHVPIGNRTRDLPTCSAVSSPSALPRTPKFGHG